MGYFSELKGMCSPVRDEDTPDYVFFGLMTLAAPALAPIYWIGRVGYHHVE